MNEPRVQVGHCRAVWVEMRSLDEPCSVCVCVCVCVRGPHKGKFGPRHMGDKVIDSSSGNGVMEPQELGGSWN